MLQSGCLGNAERQVCQCVCVESLYSGTLAVLAKLWSSVMWRFTVKKTPRSCGKLQLYRAVFWFYLFGGGLFTLQYCRLLGDCEEIVKVECILLYILLYCLYSELVSATRRHDPVSRNAHIKWNPFPLVSWAYKTARSWQNSQAVTWGRGTHREYSSKPLKHSIVERILVFKR